MASPASIAKHPIHPMLIVFPIGLWVFSLVSDLVLVLGSGSVVWNDVAFYTMAGGLVGALLAAVPGLIDFLSLAEPRVKKIGTWHLILNLLAVAGFAVNLWLRTRTAPGASLPIALSVIGVVLIGVSGWLGGEMVYVHAVAVEPHREAKPEKRSTEDKAQRRIV
jgi:uncharacterized membrane protein